MLSERRQEFLARAKSAALASSTVSGLPPGITVAQAILESAWGESELSRLAHNYFGIKAHGKHASIAMPTVEVVGGVARKITARFASYADMEQCFEDRDRMIATSALYVEARAAAADVAKFARALGKRWATDPGYAEKLLGIYEEYGLDELGRQPMSVAGAPVACARSPQRSPACRGRRRSGEDGQETAELPPARILKRRQE